MTTSQKFDLLKYYLKFVTEFVLIKIIEKKEHRSKEKENRFPTKKFYVYLFQESIFLSQRKLYAVLNCEIILEDKDPLDDTNYQLQ